ncbi:MAG: hypothetical protein JKX68_06620 [Flavobacteriales bacterium]|nr:hypothetical protein [Flavobacteriales bacterium]
MQQKDPLTGELFSPKRSNQLFASGENQIRYNNLKAQETRKVKASIHRYLDKNRTILSIVLGNNKEVIQSRDFLLGAGFYFAYHTHNIRKNNEIWKCVYDYAYRSNEDSSIKIIKHI